METRTFSLKDSAGKAHEYETTPHPATEGQRILWQLVALGAEPLARLIGAVAAGEGFSVKALLDDPAGIAALAARVDFGQVGGDIKRAVQSMPMADLTRQILSKTLRDGKPLEGQAAFDAAYTCNYGEFLRAVWEVVRINGFLPL